MRSAVQARAEFKAGAAKARMNEVAAELQDKRDEAEVKMRVAYESYVSATNAEIDAIKAKMANADEQARAKLVELIEERQAQLEELKRELQKGM